MGEWSALSIEGDVFDTASVVAATCCIEAELFAPEAACGFCSAAGSVMALISFSTSACPRLNSPMAQPVILPIMIQIPYYGTLKAYYPPLSFESPPTRVCVFTLLTMGSISWVLSWLLKNNQSGHREKSSSVYVGLHVKVLPCVFYIYMALVRMRERGGVLGLLFGNRGGGSLAF